MLKPKTSVDNHQPHSRSPKIYVLFAHIVSGVDAGSGLQKQARTVNVATTSSPVQRRGSLLVGHNVRGDANME